MTKWKVTLTRLSLFWLVSAQTCLNCTGRTIVQSVGSTLCEQTSDGKKKKEKKKKRRQVGIRSQLLSFTLHRILHDAC